MPWTCDFVQIQWKICIICSEKMERLMQQPKMPKRAFLVEWYDKGNFTIHGLWHLLSDLFTLNPLHPNTNIQILHTLLRISFGTDKENLFRLVTISLILMIFINNSAVLLWGEITRWSLSGLNRSMSRDWSDVTTRESCEAYPGVLSKSPSPPSLHFSGKVAMAVFSKPFLSVRLRWCILNRQNAKEY